MLAIHTISNDPTTKPATRLGLDSELRVTNIYGPDVEGPVFVVVKACMV
jgi:hypothetical protein